MGKELIFYGTGAAEGIPNPFCDCYLCRNAREKGGKDIRKRSMFRLSESTAIDLGADSFVQAINFGDYLNLVHIFITHTHEDHLAYMMMGVRKMATHRINKPLNYYLTDKAYDVVTFYRNQPFILKGSIKELERNGVIAFHRLEFGKEYMVDGACVVPLKGNHIGNMGENCANYLIRLFNGKTLFYGLDTGYYHEETFTALKEYRLDYYISECTYGIQAGRPARPGDHLDAASCLLVFRRLLEQGTIDRNTSVYLTHINHAHTGTHEKLTEIFSKTDLPCNIHVAYDGMQIQD